MNWGHRIHFLEGVQGTDWQLQEKSAVFINDGGSSKCEHLYGSRTLLGETYGPEAGCQSLKIPHQWVEGLVEGDRSGLF